MDEQQLHNGPMSSWNSCTPATHAVSGCLGVGCFVFGGATARKSGKKFARSLDLDPNECEAQSAPRGCLSVMNYRFADSFSRLTQSTNSSAALTVARHAG